MASTIHLTPSPTESPMLSSLRNLQTVSSCLPTHQNNVFIGDFNLHVSNQLDTDATIFGDSINALGLYQHVGFGMHRSGNVLDLVLSDFMDETKVLTATPWTFSH